MKKNSANSLKRYAIIGGIAAAAVICILLILFLGPFSKTHRYEKKYEAAQAQYLAGEYDKALRSLDDALQLKEAEDVYLLMAESYLAMGDPAHAESVLRLADIKFDSSAIDTLLARISNETKTEEPDVPEDVGTVEIAGQEIRLDATIVSVTQKGLTDLTPFMQLTALESLTLTDNRISDLSPLAALESLSYLQLAGNQIGDLSPLKALTNLRSLYLDGNEIADFSPLESLHGLTTLSLRKIALTQKQLDSLREALPGCSIYCDSDSIVEELTLGGETFLSDVTELNLGGKNITDISVLKKCTRLEKLDLRDNQISNIDALSGLTELNWLCLWNNEVEDVAALLPLEKLRYLDLDNNSITNLTPLKGLLSLEELWLSGSKPKNFTALAELTKLRRLGLKETELTAAGIEILCGLTELKELAIEKNELSAQSLESLERALPECTITHDEPYFIFKVGDKEYKSTDTESISAPGPKSAISSLAGLEQFKKLKTLIVNDNQITDLAPIAELTNLQELSVGNQSAQSGGNRFADLSPLAGLTGLRKLLLTNCGVSDLSPLAGLNELREIHLSDNLLSGISALSGMKRLSVLSLDYTGISDVSALSGLTELSCLSLEGNPISDLTPLYGMKNLTTLYISGCDITREQLLALQQQLPNCSISTDLELSATEPVTNSDVEP